MELKELFLEKLEEIASAEQLLVANLPDLIHASSNPELRSAFITHLSQTQEQSWRIDEAFASLNLQTSHRPCRPMGALVAVASQVSVQSGSGSIRDLAIVGIALRIEHSEIACYLSAIAVADALNYTAASKLLRQNLAEEEHTADHLQQIGDVLLQSTPAAT